MSTKNYSDEEIYSSLVDDLLNDFDDEISIEEQIEIAENLITYCEDLFNRKLPENYNDPSVVKYIPLFAILYETANREKNAIVSLNLEKLIRLVATKSNKALKFYLKKFGEDVVKVMCGIVNEINHEPSRAPKPEIAEQLLRLSKTHSENTNSR